MNNVKEKVIFETCTGCGACVDSCPVGAITLEINDKDWHLHPVVDESKCINCGKCTKVCPSINEKKQEEFNNFGVAAVADDKTRELSSSGGMFSLLADYVLEQGGYVAGAAFDDTLTVRHIITNKKEDLEKLRGSKYVQSNAAGIYKQTEEILKKNKQVLFVGTPCQVAALKNYLGKDYENLLAVDILCHGTPSPKLLDLYLRENFNKNDIKNIIFRNKKHRNANPQSITIQMKDGREFYSEYFDNSYAKLFLGNVSERESCYECKFAEFPRVGDISLGDFWGAKAIETKIDYEKGCSVVFINNKKGDKVWKNISKKVKTIENFSLTQLMAWNRNHKELKHNARFKELVEQIKETKSVRTAATNILENKYEVGVFGVTMNPNFGGLITYWALYEAIKNMGYKTVIISRPINTPDSVIRTHSFDFFERHCNCTEQIKELNLGELNKRIDKFVLGSDQVWNYTLFRCFKNSLYLDFVDDKKKKIAYAASFGHDYHSLPEGRIGHVSKCFKEFDHIGTREADGVKILKNNYHTDATHVMDPVFLVPKEKYIELANLSELAKEDHGKYVGSYIIGPNDFKLAVVNQIKNKLGIGNLNTTDGNRKVFDGKSQWFKDRNMHIKHEATVYDWLYTLINAEFVVTDSFHATCFCIMFNKPFVLLQERWALSRIDSIMNMFGLHNRWLQISDIKDFKMDDSWFVPLEPETQNILDRERDKSFRWLKNSLDTPKTIQVLSSKFKPHIFKQRVEDYFFYLLQNRKDYVMSITSCNLDKDLLSKIDFKCKLSGMKFETSKSSAFACVYDFDKDYMITKNEDYSEIKYNLYDRKLICLVDKLMQPYANNVYMFGTSREFVRASTEAGVVITIYSKSQGRIVDSFMVELQDGVPTIVR